MVLMFRSWKTGAPGAGLAWSGGKCVRGCGSGPGAEHELGEAGNTGTRLAGSRTASCPRDLAGLTTMLWFCESLMSRDAA